MKNIIVVAVIAISASSALAADYPKAFLIQTFVMPGRIPDIKKTPVPMPSSDACYEAARAFTDKGVPEDLKGLVVGVEAGCLFPDHNEPEGEGM